ncbi:MAG: 2-phospho-L-lactate guanylyltransferase [Chloroflexaceae bacterium]|nr:2-phospho-L-lactate guanylyltransferase [Chloroflexaceae bacterium]
MHAIIPMKDLSQAKTRLAGRLSPAERRTLAIYMFHTVLRTLCSTLPAESATPQDALAMPLQAVWVVSSDPLVLQMARTAGAEPVQDTAGDLNEALALARDAAQHDGADALLIVPADVPLITVQEITDLAHMLRATAATDGNAAPRAILVPDQEQQGTNALGLTLPTTMPFLFGADSFVRHSEAAYRLGIALQVYSSSTLALDVDTPDDLAQIWHISASTQNTQRRTPDDNHRIRSSP